MFLLADFSWTSVVDSVPAIPAQLLVSVLLGFIIANSMLGAISYFIYLERKMASWIQDRIGPNRVGFGFGLIPMPNNIHIKHALGLGQPLVDGVKMLMKEDYTPNHVDKMLFLVAPGLAIIPALMGWAVIPWGGEITLPLELLNLRDMGVPIEITGGNVMVSVANLDVGVLYILATGSLAVYGVSIGAWASNNKYSFIGGIRATAQMLSYEIPMGVMVICVLLLAGTSNAEELSRSQFGYYTLPFLGGGGDYGLIPKWFVLQQPLAFVIFFICALAEANRAPFDLSECEQELVGGFQTEYSSMKYGLFPLAEYMHMITSSAFMAVLFFGGWSMPYVDMIFDQMFMGFEGEHPVIYSLANAFLKIHVFMLKIFLLIFLMMWIRWTIPRFRFDQLMKLGWRSIIPMSIGLLLLTGVMVYLDLQNWMWLASIIYGGVLFFIIPMLPQGPDVNQRVKLEGSRFSAPD